MIVKEKDADGVMQDVEKSIIKKNGKWGYIDTSGKTIIDFQFDAAEDFYDGLAPVKVDDKWGYIDSTGRLKIMCKYDQADCFSEGLACVKQGKKYGYIKPNGSDPSRILKS